MNWKRPMCFALAAAMLAGCSAPAGTDSASSDDGLHVVVQFDADLNTMDHNMASDQNSFVMQTMCMSGLTSVDEDNQPLPEIAEKWDISDDGKKYTFHLSKDAKWSDGTPITAADFVYGWQRLVNPETASEYGFILDTMHIKNAAEVNAGEKPLDALGVKAVDDYTLEVELDLPCEFFLSLLAFPSMFPVNQAFYEAHEDTYAQSIDDLLFSGPYEMSDWSQGSEYTFTKRDDYFKEDPEAAESVTFKFIQDTQSALLAYEQGDINVVKLQSEQVDQYKDTEGFENKMTGFLWYLMINLTNQTLQNDDLRAALAYATDRETIATDVLKDGSIAAEGLIPRELAKNAEGKDFRDEAGPLTEYDPAKAKEHYDAAVKALGKDPTVELLFEDSEACKAVAENLQAQWQKACPGLTVTLNSKPKKTRLQLLDQQAFEVCLTRWGPDYGDPQTYMDLFTSTNGANNDGKYANPDYDVLVNAASYGDVASDPVKRWENYMKAEKIIVQDDHGVIPVYQNGGAMMIDPKLEGIKFHSAGVDDYRNIHAVE